MGHGEKSNKEQLLEILNSYLGENIASKNAYMLVCESDGGEPHKDVLERYRKRIRRTRSLIRRVESAASDFL
jgi:hypothetical protein